MNRESNHLGLFSDYTYQVGRWVGDVFGVRVTYNTLAEAHEDVNPGENVMVNHLTRYIIILPAK